MQHDEVYASLIANELGLLDAQTICFCMGQRYHRYHVLPQVAFDAPALLCVPLKIILNRRSGLSFHWCFEFASMHFFYFITFCFRILIKPYKS